MLSSSVGVIFFFATYLSLSQVILNEEFDTIESTHDPTI